MIEVTSDKIVGKQKSVLKSVLQEDLENIKNTLEEINEEDFEKAVDVILESKRIYILGIRSSGALASFLGFYLNLVFDNVNLVYTNSASEVFEQMLRVGSGDVVIGISFPRYSKKTVRAMEYANAKGATVIAITDGNNSPLVKYAHHSLIAKSNMVSFVDSIVAPMSIINALLVSISMKKKNEISQNFGKLESIWSEYQVYNYDSKDEFYD
jgi:DNA-binding MurR/RpiR family transcriptional regulator